MKRILKLIALMLSLALLASCAGEPDIAGTAENFTVGYGERDIAFDIGEDIIYVAGYRGGNRAQDVLDVPKVKAVWLEAGESTLLISVDCVGLASGTVKEIRDALSWLVRESGCGSVHIMSTQDHAGGDTLGLWGEDGVDGKNEKYMESLIGAAVEAASEAFSDRRSGDILFGYADCSELLEDTRKPVVFDPNVYCFSFEPDDGSPGVRILNLASHAEALGGDNSQLTANFPAYIEETIAERTGDRTVFFTGAIGGLIRTAFREADPIENCVNTGKRIAEAVLGIDNAVKLEPRLAVVTEHFEVECENPLFIGMKFLGALGNDLRVSFGKARARTELTLITLGAKRILLLPGEIFPELVYGADSSFSPTHPEREDPDALCGLIGEELLIFGLADDEIGYIVPPSDFELHPEHPYLKTPEKDKNGENHYEETNSVGPGAAKAVAEAVKRLLGKR